MGINFCVFFFAVKNTDPVQELLKLAKGIQAQIPISQKQAPLMEMSLKLIQESPIRVSFSF